MFIANYIDLMVRNEKVLRDQLLKVAMRHPLEPDVAGPCTTLASWSNVHLVNLGPIRDRFNKASDSEPEQVEKGLFHGMRKGEIGLLRDLHDLFLLATEVNLTTDIVKQASQALHDKELEQYCAGSLKDNERQLDWIRTRIRQASTQVLVAV